MRAAKVTLMSKADSLACVGGQYVSRRQLFHRLLSEGLPL